MEARAYRTPILLLCTSLLVCLGCAGAQDGGKEPADPPDAARCPVDVEPGEGIAVTETGAVQGARIGGTWAYLGIPYAAAPVGPLRWSAPRPADCWSGLRDATQWGAACPQPDSSEPGEVAGNEDCLFLNVWTPVAKAGAPPKPVLVFVHGGGLLVGSAGEQVGEVRIYDGATLAEKGDRVVVTFNYRLGALGYLAHPALTAESGVGSSGNYGLLDQIAALEWVQRNIAAFGGDPRQVLVFGQSAGAVSVCALVASPLASGLFAAAVMESGACVITPLSDAEAFGESLFAAAGCADKEDPLACMRGLGASSVVSAQPLGADLMSMAFGYRPVLDAWAVLDRPDRVIAQGRHNPVPMIIGFNSEETNLAVSPVATEEEYRKAVHSIVGNEALGDILLQAYPAGDYSTPRDALVALTTDAMFRCQARRALRAVRAGQGGRVWGYQFAHALENGGPKKRSEGAWHGLELLFVFGNLEVEGYQPSSGERELSDTMIGYWARLAEEGDPNGAGGAIWPQFDTSEQYLRIDTESRIESVWPGEKCDFWDAALP